MDLEEALAQADVYAEETEVCTIDNDLRTITIPSGLQTVGVESDEDVRRLNFQMPKQYGEVDLSEFNIRINFLNANNSGDVYAVTDKAVSGDNITFSWLVGRNALAYRGSIRFIACLKKADAEGVVQQEFNTTIAQLTVLEGLETTEAVVAENPDIIEQILARLDELEENGGGGGTPGKDGREVELQNNGTAIQWRYVGESEWKDLVQLSEITGKAATISVGNVTTGEAETDASVQNTGTESDAVFDFTIPKGKDGNDGVTPNIQIGEVTTLEPTEQATASVTGTTENPLLNLGIPRGQDGAGGGSAEKEWKLVSEITIQEQVNSIEITQDSEGNPLELTGLHIIASAKCDDDTTQQATMIINGIEFANIFTVYKNSTDINQLNNYSAATLIGPTMIGGSAGGTYGGVASGVKYNCANVLIGKINSITIKIASAQRKFEIGSKFMIYGR